MNSLRIAGLAGTAAANSINASGWNAEATDYFSFGFTVAPGHRVTCTSAATAPFA